MVEKELQIVVQQEVGAISWNFEEIKPALASMMKDYEGLVYTEENVKVAKNDIAFLRKLKKAISDKRIELKNKCLEPYEIFEKQAAELTEMIDKPIATIDIQLSDYEKNRREGVKAKILAFMDEEFKVLPSDVAKTVKKLRYDTKWENVSTATSRWKQGVSDACRKAQRDLAWIDETVEDEFKELSIEAYARNLELKDVMDDVTKARKQKEAILARERERIAAEERAKVEAEMKAKMESTVVPQDDKPQDTPSNARECVQKPSEPSRLINDNPHPLNVKNDPSRNTDDNECEIRTFRIRATKLQFDKIQGYINYCGATFREV